MSQGEKCFIVQRATRDLDEFKLFAKEAARLKPYGRVMVNIGALADKAFHELPEGGSPWHEYAVNSPALHRVFPHPALAPHVPADWVKKNQELVAAKTAVLRKHKLDAAFHGNEPHYWPESFWQEHPHLRGPRVDHPRRGLKEEFAVCVDLPESQEMIEWMMCELKKSVPELGAYVFSVNDAGSGFCWAAALYPGPNGPGHCRHITAGERVRSFIQTLQRGAKAGGGEIEVYIAHCNFWQNELYDVANRLPTGSHIIELDKGCMRLRGVGVESPVRGLVDPLALVAGMERFGAPDMKTVFAGFGAPYGRSNEPSETVAKALDIVIDCIDEPTHGLRARLDKLHKLCERWAGNESAERLFEALYDMNQGLRMKHALVPQFRPRYVGCSMRHVTRPLVIKPELLTAEEEAYFLPYVFNVSVSEARSDYIDLHGGRMKVGAGDEHGIPALQRAFELLRRAAGVLEDCREGPEAKWLFHLATAVRIYVSVIRSISNFYFGQLIRDKHTNELAGEPRTPPKEGSWTGEGDILPWNELMRDELDNANELIALLEERGMDELVHAEDERHQDCFLLGPDVIGDLKKKVRIMREHWRDVEKYLAPPSK